MKIAIAVPDRPGTTSGNSVTGRRWAQRLRELGHDATVLSIDAGEGDLHDDAGVLGVDADLLVALHATRCARVVARMAESRPEVPIVVGLAGTDLYRDLPDDESARHSLAVARHLVVLQDDAIDALGAIDPTFAEKASVVHQSVDQVAIDQAKERSDGLTVVLLAHLRDVKDPLLAARAARRLDPTSTVRIEHAGAAHSDAWAGAARDEMAVNPRYTWHGPLERDAADALLARADVLACTSRLEGGANAVTEALARGVAVIGTDIGGNRGLLGPDHPGLVPVGDASRLAVLLGRLDGGDTTLLDELRARSCERRWITEPDHERRQWTAVVDAIRR